MILGLPYRPIGSYCWTDRKFWKVSDNSPESFTKSVSMKSRLNEKYLLTMPKNKQSVRNVPIPEKLAKLIRFHLDYLKWQKGYSKDWFLCGGPMPIPDTTADKMKEDAEERAGIPHIRVHDLRHSYASLLINKGTDIAVISRLMGHGSPAITYKIYSHFYPETNYKAIEDIDSLMDIKESEIRGDKKEKEKGKGTEEMEV